MTTTTRRSTIDTPQTELEALVAALLPRQGEWEAEGYLWLTDHTNRLVEFTDGYIEVLPMPTDKHQAILEYLYITLRAFVRSRGGVVRVAALRVQVRPGMYREPDLIVLRDAGDPRRENRVWHGADLVIEIVSPDNPDRDLVEKRRDYAAAHIPEYWIADPRVETITVLRLEGDGYVEHGVFGRDAQATSALLPDFSVEVSAIFDAD